MCRRHQEGRDCVTLSREVRLTKTVVSLSRSLCMPTSRLYVKPINSDMWMTTFCSATREVCGSRCERQHWLHRHQFIMTHLSVYHIRAKLGLEGILLSVRRRHSHLYAISHQTQSASATPTSATQRAVCSRQSAWGKGRLRTFVCFLVFLSAPCYCLGGYGNQLINQSILVYFRHTSTVTQ